MLVNMVRVYTIFIFISRVMNTITLLIIITYVAHDPWFRRRSRETTPSGELLGSSPDVGSLSLT